MKMNIVTKTLLIIALIMGTSMTSGLTGLDTSQIQTENIPTTTPVTTSSDTPVETTEEAPASPTETTGHVPASPQEQAVTANMQYASSNPNVTCIRAKLAFAKAKQWLNTCKKNLAEAQTDGGDVSEWTVKLQKAQQTYDLALTLLKKVTVAKTETRMALKKYYVIEKKAKEAEKRAIIAEEKAQLAKKLVTRYEKKEYVVRKCKSKPRNLTHTEKKIVKTLTKKVVNLKHKVVVIKKTIKKLNHQLPKEPEATKPQLVHKINVLKKTFKKITHKIVKIKKVIKNIKKPAPIWNKPRPLEKVEQTIVHKLVHKTHKIVKKIHKIHKTIKKLEQVYETAPEPKKPVI